jgi:hypothetical protein
MKTEHERWLCKVNKESEEGCWNWEGATYRKGYGHFRRLVDGTWKMYKAHRYSFEYFKNEKKLLNSDTLVCHSCDNPKCVNPKHLFTGSYSDNNTDAMKKGRHNYGIRQGHRIITDQEVINIRKDYQEGEKSLAVLSEKYKTSKPQIWRIVKFKTHRKAGTEN